MGTKRERGPSGERVAENVRALRNERRLTLDDVAGRLADLGHPILKSGLSKIESGDRKVSVDDLVAISIALETNPNRLLLGGEVSRDDEFGLTEEFDVTSEAAWRWACGQLSDAAGPFPWARFLGDGQAHASVDEMRRFEAESRPHDPPILMAPEEWRKTDPYRRALFELWWSMHQEGLGGEHFDALLRNQLGAIPYPDEWLTEGYKAQYEAADHGEHPEA